LEAAVANIAFITKESEFVTPRFETVVKGTTVTKCFERIEELIK
jgi:branched-subunit amino acid aminotransferase/4-amino-4-deoxychorismate lyase